MRRLLAIAIAGAVASTSVASATAAICPAMRARALTHCCCPPGQSGSARLTCCTQDRTEGAASTSAREPTERVQLGAPLLVAIADTHPGVGAFAAVIAAARERLASAAGPPPVPLRI